MNDLQEAKKERVNMAKKQERVKAAVEMYRAFPLKNGEGPKDPPHNETLVDMVTDILHLAHRLGQDPAGILRMAGTHIGVETSPPTFARVAWTADDVLSLRENWTEERAMDFLLEKENDIRDRTIEHGWEVIEGLLPPEEEPEADRAEENERFPDRTMEERDEATDAAMQREREANRLYDEHERKAGRPVRKDAEEFDRILYQILEHVQASAITGLRGHDPINKAAIAGIKSAIAKTHYSPDSEGNIAEAETNSKSPGANADHRRTRTTHFAP